MDAYKNFAYSTVATAPTPASSGTSLVVAASAGTAFPAVPFNATVWPAGAQPTNANAEIVRVTNIATDTFTITRTQESTSARSIVVGDQIAATWTAKLATDIASYSDDRDAAHEFAYNEFTSDVSVTATTEGTANTVVTASAVSFDGSTVAVIEFQAYAAQPDSAAAARNLVFWLYQDGSSIGELGRLQTPAAAVLRAPIRLARRMTPASGSRTYSIRASVSAGTGTVSAGAGGAATAMPGFVRITRV